MSITKRIKSAYNAFFNKDPTSEYEYNYNVGPGYSYKPDRIIFARGNERSTVTSIYNRIAIDVANINFVHARVDENGRFIEQMNTHLNECLTVESNIDQSHTEFIQDIVESTMQEGSVAVVPIDTLYDPNKTSSYDICTMRVGKIVTWYADTVKVNLYNDRIGQKEDLVLPKRNVAIITNPLYTIINEPNSTMQRLIRKLSILDAIDEQSGSGKLDLLIQLPYIVKTPARKEQAENRRKDIEEQLAGSKYGIAYIDGTEKVTQLNRPVENNLMSQIEYLTNMLYSQLGINQSVLDGTADVNTMNNYYNRTVQPIVSGIVNEFKRKFITKTARTQGQTIYAYRDPFKLIPMNDVAEIADKFTRNEIMSSNEIRQSIGLKPSNDPKADELRNSNISQPKDEEIDDNQNYDLENK